MKLRFPITIPIIIQCCWTVLVALSLFKSTAHAFTHCYIQSPFLLVTPTTTNDGNNGPHTAFRTKIKSSTSSTYIVATTPLFQSDQSNNDIETTKENEPSNDQDLLSSTNTTTNTNISSLQTTLSLVRDNLSSGTVGARGEAYFVGQALLVLGILVGTIPDALSFALGPGLFSLGVGTIVAGVVNLGATNLSPWPRVPATDTVSLVTTGFPYGLVRHPIYAGLLATCGGFSVWTDDATRVVLTVLLYVLLDAKSAYEEKSLLETFGPDYVRYQTEVPGKFLPW